MVFSTSVCHFLDVEVVISPFFCISLEQENKVNSVISANVLF